MRRAALLALAALLFAACGDQPDQSKPAAQDDGGGAHGASADAGGGGGMVAVGGGSAGTIADRYEKALDLIKKKDWDGARVELLAAYARTDDDGVKREIRQHLAAVDQGILSEPTYSTPQVFAGAPSLMEKKLSMRGTLLQGGPVAKVTYYFWLNAGKRIQCRFQDLTLEDKKTILGLGDGSQVLVRGTLKPAWGSDPDPYLDLDYFRLEKRAAPAPAAAP
ncbi:MAG: hypothetical protein KGL53_14620 [Elusimicrobia bacterium]|nr:hypothetical protein [Elusimicrobiota bacterium]